MLKFTKRATNFSAVGTYLVIGLLIIAVSLPPHIGAVPNTTEAIEDADWMMDAVVTGGTMDGAIANYVDQQHIRPYQANLGALGLARATQISGDSQYVDAVWDHLDWYAAHMDVDGYVHDWDLEGGVWEEAPNATLSGAYDSTDSYAATFLLAVRAAYRVDNDINRLNALRTGISRAIGAIHSTQQADGMTWATPVTYRVKLLEDNVETYHGLLAGSNLAEFLGETTLAANAASYAAAMRVGIETLWSPANNYYYWAKHENGALQSTDWSVLSPDAMEQGWTVAFQLATGARATSLLNQLDTEQPNWDQPSLNGNNYDVTLMGWGYSLMGDETRAQQIAANLRSAAIASNRAWPFNIMAAGELIILETTGEDLVFGSITIPPIQGGGGPTTPPIQGGSAQPASNTTPLAVAPLKVASKATVKKVTAAASNDQNTSPVPPPASQETDDQIPSTDSEPAPATSAPPDTSDDNSIKKVLYTTAGVVTGIALIGGLLSYFYFRRPHY